MLNSTELIRHFVMQYGPPGQEQALRDTLIAYLQDLNYNPETDPKGNLLVRVGPPDAAHPVVVTAHLDEIALMITKIEADGAIRVAELGGAYPWKWGEGPVEILTANGSIPGILSFGSIHTNAAESVAEYARQHPLKFQQTYVFTGLNAEELTALGVRSGLRVVLAHSRRSVTEFGPYLASYFLDDRADLAAMLLALETLRREDIALPMPVLFAATVSEEVGGEGVRYLLNRTPADLCIALEIGPKTPEANFLIDANPTIWVRDGYAAMDARDAEILTECCAVLGQTPHWQYLSRGGSDASCAAAIGLIARPVTLGLPVENSHGYEIMHRDAPAELARLLLAFLSRQ